MLQETYLYDDLAAKERGSAASEVHECKVEAGVGLGSVQLEVLDGATQQRLNLVVVIVVLGVVDAVEEVGRLDYNSHVQPTMLQSRLSMSRQTAEL